MAEVWNPTGQHSVVNLVEPADMRRPWHGQVLAAMQRLRSRALLPSAANVYQELQNDPDRQRPRQQDPDHPRRDGRPA